MFDLKGKNQSALHGVSMHDDPDIEIVRLRRESRQGLLTESLRLIRDIILIIAAFILVGVFFVQPVVVEGTSMLPQLHDGERLLVNKLIYYKFKSISWGHLSRGDIVVFWYPNDPDKSYVKRIIGMPGETVEIRYGRIYIDGQELHETYLDAEYNHNLPTYGPKKVDPHYYFVMGDNRDNSSDSRSWGYVPEKYIYGKAFFRYWRPSDAGFLDHGAYDLPEKKQVEDPDDRADVDE
jgi:signal peptidase I